MKAGSSYTCRDGSGGGLFAGDGNFVGDSCGDGGSCMHKTAVEKVVQENLMVVVEKMQLHRIWLWRRWQYMEAVEGTAVRWLWLVEEGAVEEM